MPALVKAPFRAGAGCSSGGDGRPGGRNSSHRRRFGPACTRLPADSGRL